MNMRGMLITATDTGVGKTWITSVLARELTRRGHRVGVLKPVSTSGIRTDDGTLVSPDALALREALGADVTLERITPLTLEGNVAPSVAIRQSGLQLDVDELLSLTREAIAWWSECAELVLVEGVGGLLCPLVGRFTVADLAVALDYPMLIVARRGLGTINHTALTVEAARSRGIRVAGLILNGSEPSEPSMARETNPQEIANLLPDIPILAEISHSPDPGVLSTILSVVDWVALMHGPRSLGVAVGV